MEGSPENFSQQDKGIDIPLKISEKVSDFIYSPYGEAAQIVCVYRAGKQANSSYIHYTVQTLNTIKPETGVNQIKKPETKMRFQLEQLKVRITSENPNAELINWGPTTMDTQGKQQTYFVNIPIGRGVLSWKGKISGANIMDCTVPLQRSAAWELYFAQNSTPKRRTFLFNPSFKTGSYFAVKENEKILLYAIQSVTLTEHRFILPGTSVTLEIAGNIEMP